MQTSSKLNYLTNLASTTNYRYVSHFSDILFGLNTAWNRVYRGVSGQVNSFLCTLLPLNPLNPYDASKHHLSSLNNDIIS